MKYVPRNFLCGLQGREPTSLEEHLQSALNGLGLKAVEARLENLLEQASKTEPSYADFLRDLLGCEVDAGKPVFALSTPTGSSTLCEELRSVRFRFPTVDRRAADSRTADAAFHPRSQ